MIQFRYLRLLACFILFAAIASWLTIFLHDPARPSSVAERADLLAAENVLSASFSAPTPPSPAHWAQREIWLDLDHGRRFPVSRDAAVLMLASAGGNPRVAGVISFALAGLSLTWLLTRAPKTSLAWSVGLSVALLIAVAHGRAWQLSDPFPFVLLASSSLFFAGWIDFRALQSRRAALVLGAGLSGILLCQSALAAAVAGVIVLDMALNAGRRGSISVREQVLAWGWVLLIPILLCALFAVRNTLALGSPLPDISARYELDYTSAPRWFWQSIRPPPPKVDWVIEHYDELVALPGSRWETPVIKSWGQRLGEGSCYAGGAVFVLIALAFALFRPRAQRPALLLCGSMAFVSWVSYAMTPAWWTLATPAIAWLVLHLRAEILASSAGAVLSKRLTWTCIAAQIALLPAAGKDRPSAAEYDYSKYLGQIEKRLAEEGGKHLIFTHIDLGSDPRVEPANLPRDWSNRRFLYARELGKEKDRVLVEAMPDRIPWTITIFRDSIGLLPWKPPVISDSAKPAEGSAAGQAPEVTKPHP